MKYFLLAGLIFLIMIIAWFETNRELGYDFDQEEIKVEFPHEMLEGKCKESKLSEKWVVHWWASWCPTCVEDLPKYVEIIRNFPRIHFYLVSVDSNPSDIEKLVSELKPFPVNLCMIKGDKKIALLMGTSKYPESYVFNRQKSFLYKLIGGEIISPRMINALSRK